MNKFFFIKSFLFAFVICTAFNSKLIAQKDSLEGLLCDEIIKENFSENTIRSLKAKGVDLNCMCGFESRYLSLKSLLPNYKAGRIFWKKKYNTSSYELCPLEYALLQNKDSLVIALLNAGANPYAKVISAGYTNDSLNTIQSIASKNDSSGLMLLEKCKIDITKVEYISVEGFSVTKIFLNRNFDPKKLFLKQEIISKITDEQLSYLLQKGVNTSFLKFTFEDFNALGEAKANLLLQNGFSCEQINFHDCTAENAKEFINRFPRCINAEKSGLGVPLYLVALSTLIYNMGYKDQLISPMPLDKLQEYRKQGADLSVNCIFTDVNKAEYETYSPVNLYEQAIATNDEAFLKYLLQHKVKVIYKNEYNVSPLFMAIRINNSTFVKLLVEGGFDTNAKNHDGKSPLRYAKKLGRKEIAGYLKSLKGK